MQDAPHTPAGQSRATAWPIAVTIIAVVAILAATSLVIFYWLREIPRAAVEQTREVLESVESVAAAFRQGTVELRFLSYATTVSGSSYLQFATLRRTEVFTRADQAAIFWGMVELPDVVVSASAPVEYTAYLDLEDSWEFRLEDGTLRVEAPVIRFNRPAIDASRIEFEVREGSLLRDEDAAIEELRRGLTRMSVLRSRELVSLVRDTGRQKVEEFVRTWLLQAFEDAGDLRIEVVFADEADRSPGPLAIAPEE